MTITLERPTSRSLDASDEPVLPSPGRRPSHRRGSRGLGLLTLALTLGIAVVAMVLQFRNTDFGVLTDVRWLPLAGAVACIGLSLVAASYNLLGFTPLPLRLMPTLGAQLAVSGLRIVAPSAVSTPVIAVRYLTRSGASMSAAAAAVAAAQAAQLVVTAVLVAALGLASGEQTLTPSVDPAQVRSFLGVAIVLATLGSLLIRVTASPSGRPAKLLATARDCAGTLGRHARERTVKVVVGVVASAALTVTHVLAFDFCVVAVGGHASFFSLTIVYLAAAGAGSLIPTPGGVGAVEATLVAGLAATGLPLPAAAAATMLSRVVSVWLPAVPGWFALTFMRRAGLL